FVLFTYPLAFVIWVRNLRAHNKLSDANILKRWGHLYSSYKPEFCWWEAVEMLRKFTLTGLIVIFDSGSPVQLILGLIISTSSHVVYGTYNPHQHKIHASSQHAALSAISATLMLGFGN